MRLKNVLIFVKDIEKSRQFYHDLFGLELISRDYQVYIGKSGDKEIDFIAEKNGELVYIQVARAIISDETREREFAPLLAVHNHYPKYVVTMDELTGGTIDGVRHVHIADFLLMDSW